MDVPHVTVVEEALSKEENDCIGRLIHIYFIFNSK